MRYKVHFYVILYLINSCIIMGNQMRYNKNSNSDIDDKYGGNNKNEINLSKNISENIMNLTMMENQQAISPILKSIDAQERNNNENEMGMLHLYFSIS